MLESGRLVDAVSNLPTNEARTAMSSPEDVKYGFKNTQFIIQPILAKEDEKNPIQLVI